MIPVYYSDQFLDHQTGLMHPEAPARLSAIKQRLEASPFADQIEWRSPTSLGQLSPLPAIQRVHTDTYIHQVRHLAAAGGGYLDGDTPISSASYDVALLAVNAWLDGVDTVLRSHHPCFVLARPPGHHALANRGMGFCVFANAAIAAYSALQHSGVHRVAILDWDVHHGNGTQALISNNPNLFYCSLHQSPCYPGTGQSDETGEHQNVLNLPMSPGSQGIDYQAVFEERVFPFLSQVSPDLLIVSAGYDANSADPLAEMNLQPEDFGIFTQYCLRITSNILFGLEGGYDLEALAASVQATLKPCCTAS